MSPLVLVVTSAEDVQADMVVAELAAQGADVVRLHPGDDEPILLDAVLHEGGWVGTIAQHGRAARLEAVRGVLWRKAHPPPGHPHITDEIHRDWAARQDRAALWGVLTTLSANWLNHPDRADACTKPAQLLAAQQLGLAVPGTLLTRTGATAARWAGTLPRSRSLLSKPLHGAVHGDAMVPARHVARADVPDGELYAVTMFQPLLCAAAHLRATVVGDRIYTAKIVPADPGQVDWRADQDQAAMTAARLPSNVEDALVAFLRRFGLAYGAFDLIAEPDGTVWFLECNPAGMWGFAEMRAGLPITAAIADHLTAPM